MEDKLYKKSDNGTYVYYKNNKFRTVDDIKEKFWLQAEIHKSLKHEYYLIQDKYILDIFNKCTKDLKIKNLEYYIERFFKINKEFRNAYTYFINNISYCRNCEGSGIVYTADCSNPYDMHDYSPHKCPKCNKTGQLAWTETEKNYYLYPQHLKDTYKRLFDLFGKGKDEIIKNALNHYFDFLINRL